MGIFWGLCGVVGGYWDRGARCLLLGMLWKCSTVLGVSRVSLWRLFLLTVEVLCWYVLLWRAVDASVSMTWSWICIWV